MYIVLMVLIILVGFIITAVVLMLNSKGGGLSGAFGGAGAGVGSMLGVRRASDVLAKTTWIAAGIFVFLIFVLNLFFLPTEGTEESVIQRTAAERPLTPAERAKQQPAQPMQPQQQPAQQQPAQQPAPTPGQ
jgi:preprotein translocase subunit SecG